MKFHTDVDIPRASQGIRHDQRLMLLGSCFADNIGERFLRGGFPAEVNPFGTLYNPESVSAVLTRMLEGRRFEPSDIHPFGAEGYGSWMSHSLLSRSTAGEALEELNVRLDHAAAGLQQTDVLLVTFGTAWVYRLKESGAVVANCHHEPSSLFVRQRLTVADIVGLWQPLLERLSQRCPTMRVVFTVSPIRHLRDGAHGNQLSKATLLLAVEELIRVRGESEVVIRSKGDGKELIPSYFPAYEIVVDELRDYRFYADDMVHPSPLTVDYLWQRFADTFFDASTQRAAQRIEEVERALSHRPLHPESDDYQQFLRQTLLKITDIQKDFPYFDARNLLHRCHTLLNT